MAATWARGTPEVDDGPLRQLIEANAPPALIEQMRERLGQMRADAVCHVWPKNWHALRICADLPMRQTWLSAGAAGRMLYQGFDLSALPLILAAHKGNPHRQPWPVLWRQIKAFEGEALSVLNDRD